MKDAGYIPFFEDDLGYNPGRLLEVYISHLHPTNERLFQLVKTTAKNKSFDIHRKSCDVWFDNSPIGKMQVGTLLKSLCDVVGVPPLTNQSIRYDPLI